MDVIPGDARLSLERESPQAFDVFILDAFSSDAIPVHLLTREAFDLYLQHLAPDGVIAVLISSWHFDFEPLLMKMADHFDLQAVLIGNSAGELEDWGSRWMIMTRNSQFMQQRRVRLAQQESVGIDQIYPQGQHLPTSSALITICPLTAYCIRRTDWLIVVWFQEW